MGNTSTYNREYYLKNRERINENAKRRRANMTADEREKYLNRMRECYRKHNGYYVSRKQLLEENKKLKEDSKILESAIGDVVRENRRLKEERIFSLGEYDYMILTSTTPLLKIIKKKSEL